MNREKQQKQKGNGEQSKRPFAKNDLEAVLKAATKPLKKDQAERESKGTSESHHHDDSI